MSATLAHVRIPDTADCVRCGLCLESCPTYVELRNEADSPRGRIALMRAMDTGRLAAGPDTNRHLDLCLDCRACESACPSGVQYGALIEAARAHRTRPPAATLFEKMRDHVLFNVLPSPRRLRRWLSAWRFVEAIGLTGFFEQSGLRQRWGMPPLPRIDATESVKPLRDSYPSEKQVGRQVALFAGCVTEAITPQTNRAALRVLNRGGCDVDCPSGQGCCGAIHYHAGRKEEARKLARANLDAFDAYTGQIVVTAAGCGAMLRQYGELFWGQPESARAERFTARVRDVSEIAVSLSTPVHAPVDEPVTYHDACHLCHAQGIRHEPRAMLASAGRRVIPLEESELCCGAAGTYSLMQPRMAAQLAARKWDNIRRTGARVVAAANVGCILHLRQHAPADLRQIRVVHPIELLSEAQAGDSDDKPAISL